MYHNSMPNAQMSHNAMSNGHMMPGNLPPQGMQVPQSNQMVRDQNMHPGNMRGPLPNLPTMPLPPSMSSSMMTSGSLTSSSSTPPSMSNMSVAQMQQPQLPSMPHQHGSMHNMGNAPMGNMTNGPMNNMTNGPIGMNSQCGPGGGPPGGMSMYNNSSHNGMMDPAMVRRAQGRYRLGTPNTNSNMRPGVPMNQSNHVMPGQNSPIGGGMQQPPVISNQNVRQQVR